MHAVIVEGGSASARAAQADELLLAHFADDPLAAGKLAHGVFEDLVVIEPDEAGKDVTVSKIEALIALFAQKPFASTGKACVFPQGERMNEAAQNKLLKLLEEPAAGDVIVILTDNAQRLLPTVRSRCARVWLGYTEPVRAGEAEDLRTLAKILVYKKDTLAEANAVLSRHDGSREDAEAFVRAFQLFMRDVSVGRLCPGLIGGAGDGGAALAQGAAKVQKKHADRMRKGVLAAEKTLEEIARGDRVRYALRKMAIEVRSYA